MIVVNFDDLDADTNPDPLPALCGGHTRIDGDLDGDDATLCAYVIPSDLAPEPYQPIHQCQDKYRLRLCLQ